MNIFLLVSLFLSSAYTTLAEPGLFGLPKDDQDAEVTETVREIDHVVLPDGAKMSRVRHYLDGIPIWNDGATVVNRNGTMNVVSFKKMNNKAKHKFAKTKAKGKLPKEMRSRNTCRKHWNLGKVKLNFATSQRYIYDPEPNNPDGPGAVYADLVGFQGVIGNEPINKVCLVNTDDNSVIVAWDGMLRAWDGGNLKTERYSFGQMLVPFTQNDGSGICSLVNAHRKIYVYDMENSFDIEFGHRTPYSFSCSTGPTDGDEQAYGPLADAFYTSIVSYDMLAESNWGGLSYSQITKHPKIQIGVHYGRDLPDAMYNGNDFLIGSGNASFYPQSTCLDVMAHELAHGVTHATSELINDGESGCLNEAFSDIVGRMTVKFQTNVDGWCVGGECMVNDGCIRRMDTPTAYSDYFPECTKSSNCKSSHECSAIPSYIFYKLATTPGWSIQTAGRAFILANHMGWNQQTTIRDAGCEVATAVTFANIANGDTTAVANAWAAAGIDLSQCINTQESGEQGTSSNPIALTNCDTLSNIEPTQRHLYYKVTAAAGSTGGHISIRGPSGDADLYVKAGSPPTTNDYDHRSYDSGSNEDVSLNGLGLTADTEYFIMILEYLPYQDLAITACFQSSASGTASDPIRFNNCGSVTGASGQTGDETFYVVQAPSGSTTATISVSGGSGDPDLYISKGSAPSRYSYHYRSWNTGPETATLPNFYLSYATDYYIMVHAYGTYSDMTISACFS